MLTLSRGPSLFKNHDSLWPLFSTEKRTRLYHFLFGVVRCLTQAKPLEDGNKAG